VIEKVQINDATLYCGDCLEIMSTLPNASVDLILCDLPYGTTACTWDSVIPLASLWNEYRRIAKPSTAIVLTASQPFTSALVMSNPKWFRYCWVWEKPVGTGFLDANRKPLKCHEDICVFYGKQPTYNPQKWKGKPNHTSKTKERKTLSVYAGDHGRVETDLSGMKYPRSVIQFDKHSASERLHPTQKPVALMEYLINTYSNPGDTVLDNTMGSGTTGVAALNTGRTFIGIEQLPEYFTIAQARIVPGQMPKTILSMPKTEPTKEPDLFSHAG
jgi:DNA modification methylase